MCNKLQKVWRRVCYRILLQDLQDVPLDGSFKIFLKYTYIPIPFFRPGSAQNIYDPQQYDCCIIFFHFLYSSNLFTTILDDWTPFACQRDQCPNVGTAEAAKVCFDHCISITYSSDTPPPLYLCIECANEIHREHPNQMFYDILHPMQQVSVSCENKVKVLPQLNSYPNGPK